MLTDQEKRLLKRKIQSQQHEIFVISVEHMDAIVRSHPANVGAQQKWERLRKDLEFGANWFATLDDINTLSKLVGDLGGITARAYVKSYGGKPHIIIKGYPGLRQILTATKYGANHPKVVTMGLGRAGATAAARSGAIISITLLTTYRVADYFLRDRATLSQLVGTLATDIVKVGIATGAAIVVATGLSFFSLAIGPLLAAIVVGAGVSASLTAIDNHYRITDWVIAGIDEMGDDVHAYIKDRKRLLQQAGEQAIDSVIDYALESAFEGAKEILIRTARHYFRRLTVPRIY